jgi:hypothetical protein
MIRREKSLAGDLPEIEREMITGVDKFPRVRQALVDVACSGLGFENDLSFLIHLSLSSHLALALMDQDIRSYTHVGTSTNYNSLAIYFK